MSWKFLRITYCRMMKQQSKDRFEIAWMISEHFESIKIYIKKHFIRPVSISILKKSFQEE